MYFIAISLLIATASHAQINFKEKQTTNGNYFAMLNENIIATSSNEKIVLKSLTECNNNFQFKFISQYGDDLKFEYKKYSIYYSGIEVVGMDFVIHEKNNIIQYLNGSFENIINPNLTIILSEINATQIAKSFFKTKNFSITEDKIKVEKLKLCFTKNYLVTNSTYCLAYSFP